MTDAHYTATTMVAEITDLRAQLAEARREAQFWKIASVTSDKSCTKAWQERDTLRAELAHFKDCWRIANEANGKHQATVREAQADNERLVGANETLTRMAMRSDADNERLREVAQRLTDTHQDSTGQWDTDALYTLQGLARAALAPSGGEGVTLCDCGYTPQALARMGAKDCPCRKTVAADTQDSEGSDD